MATKPKKSAGTAALSKKREARLEGGYPLATGQTPKKQPMTGSAAVGMKGSVMGMATSKLQKSFGETGKYRLQKKLTNAELSKRKLVIKNAKKKKKAVKGE